MVRTPPVAWTGFKHETPGRIPKGHSLIVVQTVSEWPSDRVDTDPARYTEDLNVWTEDLLVTELRHPAWYDV